MYSHLFKFPIGTEFTPIGKVKKLHKVIGHRITITETGNVIKTYYRCVHIFCGQEIESDENETTISRGL